MPAADVPAAEVWAAGGVVYRRSGATIEVVLVARPREGLWALPKGKPHAGESIEQTALREVREETGLEVAIDERADSAGKIGSIRYTYPRGGRQRTAPTPQGASQRGSRSPVTTDGAAERPTGRAPLQERAQKPLQKPVQKVVHHFLMQAHGGDTANHDAEHDMVGWYDIHEAAKRMTYPNERAILEQAHAALEHGQATP
ncbi:MAG: NUDIX domain-containing protein [Chloroflexi bacterium]|nr:NUDIX domain-containing protein [Chloroflexota bacterium]